MLSVELPAIEAIGAHPLGPALAHLRVAAAEHGADARKQFARAERLGEVIVGAELEAHHPVGLVAPSGEHDDRDRRLVAEPAREVHAVFGLEPQVEQDEVDDLALEHLGHRVTVCDRGDPQLVLPEIVRDELANRGIVVDGEDVRHRRLVGLRVHARGCLYVHWFPWESRDWAVRITRDVTAPVSRGTSAS